MSVLLFITLFVSCSGMSPETPLTVTAGVLYEGERLDVEYSVKDLALIELYVTFLSRGQTERVSIREVKEYNECAPDNVHLPSCISASAKGTSSFKARYPAVRLNDSATFQCGHSVFGKGEKESNKETVHVLGTS